MSSGIAWTKADHERQARALVAENAMLHKALDEAVGLMRDLRGHYGIEEVSGPGQEATEYDEIQDAMRMFVWRWSDDDG